MLNSVSWMFRVSPLHTLPLHCENVKCPLENVKWSKIPSQSSLGVSRSSENTSGIRVACYLVKGLLKPCLFCLLLAALNYIHSRFVNISHIHLSSWEVQYLFPNLLHFPPHFIQSVSTAIDLSAFIFPFFSSVSIIYCTLIRNSLGLQFCHCMNFFLSCWNIACHHEESIFIMCIYMAVLMSEIPYRTYSVLLIT